MVAGGKGVNSTSKAAKSDKNVSQIANGMGSMSVEDSSRARSKNLDVVAEFEKSKNKNAASFVVIGRALSS